jgi:hypothetical protein
MWIWHSKRRVRQEVKTRFLPDWFGFEGESSPSSNHENSTKTGAALGWS